MANFMLVNFLSRDFVHQAGSTSQAMDDGGGRAGDDTLGSSTPMPANAPRRPGVVVFVKDQHRRQPPHHQQQQYRHLTAASGGGELAADSASNTDSGNGTSEYSDDASPPLVVGAAGAAASSSVARRHCATAGDQPSTCFINNVIEFVT